MEIILDEAAAKARYQPRMIETVPICRDGLARRVVAPACEI